MRLIDADELKTAFPVCDNSKPVLVACVRATINHMPTIEPERKRGKWILEEYPDGYYHSECSECGQWFEESAYLKPYNFCPNCGADLRGDTNVNE